MSFSQNYARFGEGFVRAKALDNRLGCAFLLELLLAESEVSFTGAFTVQEETGCIGAKAAANAVKPDIALILETTTASDLPGNDGAKRVSVVGSGPVISYMDRGTIYPRRQPKPGFPPRKRRSSPVAMRPARCRPPVPAPRSWAFRWPAGICTARQLPPRNRISTTPLPWCVWP